MREEEGIIGELKITKERVLAAASKCGEAKTVLKELFPEAFEPKWELCGGTNSYPDGRFIMSGRHFSPEFDYSFELMNDVLHVYRREI